MADPSALVVPFAVWFVVFLFSLTLHEAAHAALAYLGGDRTAYLGGQVSINPWPHMRREPFGTVVVPILIFMVSSGGWMMGWASTPFDPAWARRHPGRMALMSLCGPMANFAIAAVALVLLRVLLGAGVFAPPETLDFAHLVSPPEGTPANSLLIPLGMMLSVAVNLNVLLGLFNLIPIPPLDGAGVLEGAGPEAVGRLYDRFRTTPFMGLLGLLVAWQVIGWVAGPAFHVVLRLLYA